MSMCPLTAYPLNPNLALSARGVFWGGIRACCSVFPLPFSASSLLLCLVSFPEGLLALKHCIRAPPTGQRNFTDRYTMKYGAEGFNGFNRLHLFAFCPHSLAPHCFNYHAGKLNYQLKYHLSILYVNWSSGWRNGRLK